MLHRSLPSRLNRWAPLAALLVSTAGWATAPDAASAPAPAPSPEVFQFPADVPVAVQLQLLPMSLKTGRDTPVFHNFMAQLRFSGEQEVLTCALRLYDPDGALLPGQTQDMAIRCLQPFLVASRQPDFTVQAGGRTIGQGRLRAAALAQVMGEPLPPPAVPAPVPPASGTSP